jgi:hypothetical protein
MNNHPQYSNYFSTPPSIDYRMGIDEGMLHIDRARSVIYQTMCYSDNCRLVHTIAGDYTGVLHQNR